MEKIKKKRSKLEYLIVFLLILIAAIFASRIFHIVVASSKGCGATCPVKGMDSKEGNPGVEQ